jgi:hypothetical protein
MLVMHNSLYDVPVLRALGFENISEHKILDTMVLSANLENPLGLKSLARRYFLYNLVDFESTVRTTLDLPTHRKVKKNQVIAGADQLNADWLFQLYAVMDAVMTLHVYSVLVGQLGLPVQSVSGEVH